MHKCERGDMPMPKDQSLPLPLFSQFWHFGIDPSHCWVLEPTVCRWRKGHTLSFFCLHPLHARRVRSPMRVLLTELGLVMFWVAIVDLVSGRKYLLNAVQLSECRWWKRNAGKPNAWGIIEYRSGMLSVDVHALYIRLDYEGYLAKVLSAIIH